MSNIVLSICIPTYNRSKLLSECIRRIIQCRSQEIEIVVSDNASTDETQDAVKKIGDPRIKYYRNDENLGFDANVLKLVERATGDFLFLLSDEDYIELEAIPWILEAIKRNRNVTQILGTIGDKRPKHKKIYFAYKDGIFKPGYESLTQVLFKCGHLSGIVLKKESSNLKQAKKYIGFCYIHQILAAQAMIAGSTLCTSKIICCVGPPGKSRSFMTKGGSNVEGKPYFHAMSRVYQLKQKIKLIYDITDEKHTQKALLNRQRKQATLLLARTFHRSFNSFLKILPLILNIKELRSPKFWIIAILYITGGILYFKCGLSKKSKWYQILEYAHAIPIILIRKIEGGKYSQSRKRRS